MRALVAPLLLAVVGLAADGPLVGMARADASAAAPSATTPMLEHADPIASYTLRARLDANAHTVHGEGTILWKNASTKPVHELWLHLYLNGFKNQSSTFMRAPVGGFRGTTTPEDWGAIDLKKLSWNDDDLLAGIELHRPGDEDETDAHVVLPRPIAPGDTATFTMEWEDKLPSVVERTGHVGSFHMIGQWFPKIAKLEQDGTFAHFPFHHLGEFYADYGRYDVTLDVPKGYVVGASGPGVETHDEGDRHVERHVQSDVHDFAWTAWDRFQTRRERIGDVDVTILFPPGYGAIAERELATMRFALPHFDARYGKYPYSVLTLVHPPENAVEAGGMEYPTLITTGQSPSWMPPGLWFPEAVTIHEYGHQYFYGLVGSYEDRWPFLDEGLNSYAENESLRHWLGAASSVDFLGFQVGDVEAQAVAARNVGHNERIAQDAASFATGADYGALVYSRTATVLETIARVHGKPRLDHALGVYARKWRFRHPTPDDLLTVIREEIGADAAENLRLALFEKGSIDLTVAQLGSSNAGPPAGLFDRDGKRETVEAQTGGGTYDGWALVVRRGTLRFPTEIELVTEDGTRTRVPWDGQGETFRAPYHGSSPLRSAVVDPDGRVLLDDDLTNNFASRRRTGAPRVFERALFWGAALLGDRPVKDLGLLPASGDSTSTLESLDAGAAELPAVEPLRVLRPSEVRARRRPRAIALVWLWELAFAVLLATPVQAWAASVWANHPDGDAPIFRPGAQDLLGWLKYGGQPFSIVLRATLIALFFAALVAPLVTGALGAQLATAQGRRAPSTRSSLRLAIGMYFPLLVVGAIAFALEALVLGLGLLASSLADHRLSGSLGDARSFLVRLVVLAVFVAVLFVVGVVGDLLRAAVVRAVAKEPEASALAVLRRAVPHAAATARRSLGRATFGWAWRALGSTALVVIGSLLGDAVGGRGGLALGALFVAHQLLIAGRAALRAGWLANALRLL